MASLGHLLDAEGKLEDGEHLLEQALEGECRLHGIPSSDPVSLARWTSDHSKDGSNRDVLKMMSSLGQLISGVAHELNNPLTSIVGYAQLMHAQAGEGELGPRLELLGREAERCRKIVSSLLSFARQRDPEVKPLSLNRVVEGVLSLLAYQMRVDNVAVEPRLSTDVPLLQGDAHQLEQVLVNLLRNALDATADNGGQITVRWTKGPSGVEIVIEDWGTGIANPANLFVPFFTTKTNGSGIGLPLCRQILENHEGYIQVRNADDHSGCLVTLNLPDGASD